MLTRSLWAEQLITRVTTAKLYYITPGLPFDHTHFAYFYTWFSFLKESSTVSSIRDSTQFNSRKLGSLKRQTPVFNSASWTVLNCYCGLRRRRIFRTFREDNTWSKSPLTRIHNVRCSCKPYTKRRHFVCGMSGIYSWEGPRAKRTARFAGTQQHSAYEMPFRIRNGLRGVKTPWRRKIQNDEESAWSEEVVTETAWNRKIREFNHNSVQVQLFQYW
jgi:hypothetical protein